MKNILIVGCGVTGAVCASLLRNAFLPKSLNISIWEKSRDTGGRMSTARSSKFKLASVDLGAQYISTNSQVQNKYKRIFDELEANNLLVSMSCVVIDEPPYPPNTRHYVAPFGMGSLVKHFLASSDAEVKFGIHVNEVNQGANSFIIKTKCGLSEEFDCIILTVPSPQILELNGGNIHNVIDSDIIRRLRLVEYSSRFAMGLFFEAGTQINVDWSIKYFKDDPVIRYVSIDSKKRGVSDDNIGPSVVVHTSVPFGLQHLQEDEDAVCLNLVLPHLKELIPAFPDPAEIKSHKWIYSQIYKNYEGGPGAVLGRVTPTLVLGGDAFSYSGLDGCLMSAFKVTELIRECLMKC